MLSLLRCLTFLTLIFSVIAAPPPHHPQKRSFKIARVPNPRYRRRTPGAGTRALMKAYRKYLLPLPPGLMDAMNAAQNGPNPANGFLFTPSSKAVEKAKTICVGGNKKGHAGIGHVTATPEAQDVEYLSPVKIGGQTMNMNFDSGSSDLWVFNTQLSIASQGGHTVYDSQRSTTFQLMHGASYRISYGDGSRTAGNVGTDTVDIGGATVTSQAIEMATAVSASFVQETESSGLLGLAFSKLNTVQPQQQRTFFENAVSTLAEPVFTADLRKAAVGSYEFGRIDSTKFNGTMQWAAINTTAGYWQFPSESFAIDNGRPQTSVIGAQAIADTGTTLMLVAPQVINAYYSQVEGAINNHTLGGITVPCSAKLPDLMVDIGFGFRATVRGRDINFAPVDLTNTNCFGGVQAIEQNPQIYGDIFFKSNFVVFNAGNMSLGVAPHGA